MDSIIKNFGIQPVLLVAQIVNFLIIFWLLKKFAYKPIMAMLEKRRKQVADGVKDAEKAQKALEDALEEEKKILKKAQTTSEGIIADAQKQAADLLTEAESGAKARVEKMLSDAKIEIHRQTQDAQKELSSHTARLAVEILEKALAGTLDTKTQKEVVEKAAKRLKA